MNLIAEIWNLLTPRQKRDVLWGQALSLAMAFSTVSGIAAVAPFFAVLGGPQSITHYRVLQWLYIQGGFHDRHRFVIALGIGFIAVVLLSNAINAAGSVALNRLALGIGQRLQTRLFEEYLSRSYLFHARSNSSTLSNNVIYEIARLTNGILQNGFVLASNTITGLFIVASVLLLNPPASLGILLTLGAGYAAMYLAVRRRILRLGRAHSQAAAERARIVADSFGAVRDIQLLPDAQVFRGGFERANRDVSEALAHVYAVSLLPKHVMECVAVAALVIVALLVSGGDDSTGAWLGELTFVAFAAYRLLPVLQQIFSSCVRIRADRASFTLLSPDLQHADASRVELPVSAADLEREYPREGIHLRDVCFRYEPASSPALEGVTLHIPARSTVGIVGANGSGKTTLMDLLAGLLVPDSGHVEVDGAPLDESGRLAWRSHVAYVPQNVFLLDAALEENIAFGVPPERIDRQRLLQATRLAQLEALVRALPQGYRHRLGERGIALSGGQRQRIGLARAFYRQATVLLLDEATSALDGLTERELLAVIGQLHGRYTVVLIAHRLSTVRACETIFELHEGRLAASGTYSQLLERSSRFRRLAGAL
jgi:HlyD family secretion protein